MFTVLPEKSLKVEAIFNNLEVDNMNSYALIDVQGCNLTLDGLPQISGLPTGLTPT
jgi:hypothetical protein